jgi:hypothetical protein
LLLLHQLQLSQLLLPLQLLLLLQHQLHMLVDQQEKEFLPAQLLNQLLLQPASIWLWYQELDQMEE